MARSFEGTVGRTEMALDWPSRIMGFTRILGGIFLIASPHIPVQALSASVPGSYSVTLAWDSSPDTNVIGFRVYYGVASGNYPNSVAVGNGTTTMVPSLASNVTHFFVVTAYTVDGLESDFSNEVNYVPGLSKGWIHVTATGQAVLTVKGLIDHTYHIEATEDFTAWTVIGRVTLGASGVVNITDTNAVKIPKRFYRTHDTLP